MDSATVIGALLSLVALMFGLGKLSKPKRGKRPGRAAKPVEPERPDVAPLDEQAARMDERGERIGEGVFDAVEGKGEQDNPHGLADLANKRRR